MKKLFDLFLIALGLGLLAYGGQLLYLRYRPISVEAMDSASEIAVVTSVPSSLTLASLDLSLPIIAAEKHADNWQTTDQGVSYLSSSPLPGEPGNSVMYGHNWPNLLGELDNLHPGDEIVVNYGTREVTFIVHYKSVVEASDVSVYAPTLDSRLTLYTCTGFFDSKRLVVAALLKT